MFWNISIKQIAAAFALSMLSALSYTPPVLAAEATSANWGVSEVNFGSGGELRACSGSYCSRQSAGELTVGNTKSTNYQAQGGFNTNREPLLELVAPGSDIDLGVLDTASTKSATMPFSVRNYLSFGYELYIDGSSPRNNTNGYVLNTLATGATSQIGVEQFGINLRQNTTPAIGSDVLQVPDSSFSFGTVAAGYDTANTFRFVAGERLAYSNSSTGQTNYTIAMIINTGTTTPGGKYAGRLVLNVVPTF